MLLFRLPGTRTKFWKAKIDRNQENDLTAKEELFRHGWRVLTVWECALRGRSKSQVSAVLLRISNWLRSPRKTLELRA